MRFHPGKVYGVAFERGGRRRTGEIRIMRAARSANKFGHVGPIAQKTERASSNRMVGGSNPSWASGVPGNDGAAQKREKPTRSTAMLGDTPLLPGLHK